MVKDENLVNKGTLQIWLEFRTSLPSISRQNEFFMILFSALLEIFFVLLQLEDEDAVEIEDERSEAGGSLEVATASAAGEGGESTWEHSLHDHVPDTKTFRCTVLFLQMEHDLRGFEYRSFA